MTEKTPWNGGIVGVSGFGMGGVNCHIALESFRKEKLNHGIPNDNLPRIVGVSGRTEEAVDILLKHVGFLFLFSNSVIDNTLYFNRGKYYSYFQLEITSLDSEFVGLLQEIHKQDIPLHLYRGLILLHKNEHCLLKKIEVKLNSYILNLSAVDNLFRIIFNNVLF